MDFNFVRFFLQLLCLKINNLCVIFNNILIIWSFIVCPFVRPTSYWLAIRVCRDFLSTIHLTKSQVLNLKHLSHRFTLFFRFYPSNFDEINVSGTFSAIFTAFSSLCVFFSSSPCCCCSSIRSSIIEKSMISFGEREQNAI